MSGPRFSINRSGFDDEGIRTLTSRDQLQTESECAQAIINWLSVKTPSESKLYIDSTTSWLLDSLRSVPAYAKSLYASHGWMTFWMTHALELMGTLDRMSPQQARDVVDFCLEVQDKSLGGFAAGYMQEPQALACYSFSMAMLIVAAEFDLLPYVFESVDLVKLREFILRSKITDKSHPHYGAFRCTIPDGEIDNRTVYTFIATASLFGILDEEISDGVAEWIAKTQTYEGGFADIQGSEAHGGYAYCAMATLVILGRPDVCDLDAVLSWASKRQFNKEGGMSGRTNKLVDGCYSFWVGSLFPMIRHAKHMLQSRSASETDEKKTSQSAPKTDKERFVEAVRQSRLLPPNDNEGWLFDMTALQQYVLMCSQSLYVRPGLKDKPSYAVDFYHTCYCLSGLTTAQHSYSVGTPKFNRTGDEDDISLEDDLTYGDAIELNVASRRQPEPNPRIFGPASNELRPNNPIYNISEATLEKVTRFVAELKRREAQAQSNDPSNDQNIAQSSSIHE